jgi:transposase
MSRPIDTTDLPNDVTALRGVIETLLADLSAKRTARQAAEAGLGDKALEAEHLRAQLTRLRRMQFGQSSERLRDQIAQLELALEEWEAEPAEAEAAESDTQDKPTTTERSRRGRKPLPERQVSTDVTEVLEYVPGRFEVVRHVRPAYSCRSCEAMCQAPMPSLPIERGRPGPGLLAHVLVSKYADHLPLYRQREIYAREGVELDRATMAAWVGKAATLIRPLLDELARHVMAADAPGRVPRHPPGGRLCRVRRALRGWRRP